MVYLLHLANIIQFACYTVRDILWLRVLAIAAACLLVPYYYGHFSDGPQWPSVGWAALFITINTFHVIWLIRDRRPPRLTSEQEKLYQDAFQAVTPNQMLKLIQLAQWRDLPADRVVVEQGVTLNDLMLITSGQATVHVDGAELVTIGPGDFVGEMSFLRRSLTNARVRSQTPLRLLLWQRKSLQKFLDRHPELRFAMQSVIGVNLVQKLSAMDRTGATNTLHAEADE